MRDALRQHASRATSCSIARRLVERGVRFVQVWAGGWDHHQDLEDPPAASARARSTSRSPALINDLKQRGLLDSTLVDLGRRIRPHRRRATATATTTPAATTTPRRSAIWLAGGGVKGGTVYGATDEFGAAAVEDKVHVHDLHATILPARLRPQKLTYRYNGRDFRLTDDYGNVVKEIMA